MPTDTVAVPPVSSGKGAMVNWGKPKDGYNLGWPNLRGEAR